MHMRWCERRKAKGDQNAKGNKDEKTSVASSDEEGEEEEEEDVEEDDEDEGGEEDPVGDENDGEDRDDEEEDEDEEDEEEDDEGDGSVDSGDDRDPLPSSLSSTDGSFVHALLQPLASSLTAKGVHQCMVDTQSSLY